MTVFLIVFLIVDLSALVWVNPMTVKTDLQALLFHLIVIIAYLIVCYLIGIF